MNIKELVDKYEIKRLSKAIDKDKLNDWALQFAEYINSKVESEQKKYYSDALEESISWYNISLIYTLWFSEETTILSNSETKSEKIERLNRFMKDMYATIELFNNHEMSPLDYATQLSEDGVSIFDEWIKKQKEQGSVWSEK